MTSRAKRTNNWKRRAQRAERSATAAAQLLAETLNRTAIVVELFEGQRNSGQEGEGAFETVMLLFAQSDLPRLRAEALTTRVLARDLYDAEDPDGHNPARVSLVHTLVTAETGEVAP
jgi:hypothetical protein